MVKVHARGCSEDRTAAALALASACFAVTPEPGKAETTTDFDRIMESASDAVYAQLDFFLENGVVFDERMPKPGVLTSPTPDQIAHMEASGLECFTREDLPDALTSTQEVAQDNSIFLAVFKDTADGARDWGVGTGTLIKSEAGENRILTADHVALFKNEMPETIYAFHASGYLLAEVEPVVFVPQDSEKTIKGDYHPRTENPVSLGPGCAVDNKSMSDQIAHWIMLGRAIEHSGTYDHKQVTDALEGRLDSTDLRDGEVTVWLEMFSEKMSKPSSSEKDFFKNRKEFGLGVGRDSSGELVFARDGIRA